MFVRRLYLHIRMSKTVMSRQNRLIEHIARKSLICLIFTFVVNLAMNLLKITEYIGDRSDVSTTTWMGVEQHRKHAYSMVSIGIHGLLSAD